MNNTHKKRKKNTRKVILIKYKDSTESLILTETVKKSRKSLKIKIQCESLPTDEMNPQNEEQRIVRKTDSIVPCCLRDKCRRAIRYKSNQCKRYRQRKSENKSKSQGKTERKRAPSIISVSDEEEPIQYDDISSGTLSSYDSEIDTLLQSTRKRMKDSNEEWLFLPNQMKSTSEKSSINIDFDRSIKQSPSLNSLDTLVLETMEDNDYITQNVIKLEPLEPDDIGPNVMSSTYESVQSSNIKREGNFEHNVDGNGTKKIKLEPPETNSNFYDESKQFLQDSNENFQSYAEWQNNAYPNNIIVVNNIIKTEPLFETKGDIIKNYGTINCVISEDRKNYETGTVRTKIERHDLIQLV